MPLQRRWAAEEFLGRKQPIANLTLMLQKDRQASAEQLLAVSSILVNCSDEANTAFNYCCEGDSALVGENIAAEHEYGVDAVSYQDLNQDELAEAHAEINAGETQEFYTIELNSDLAGVAGLFLLSFLLVFYHPETRQYCDNFLGKVYI
jgi:hypothetical protein